MFPSEKWNIALFPPINGDQFWAGVYTNAHPKEIGIDRFQILRNLVHLRKNELATRPGFALLSDSGTTPHILRSAPLGVFRHYTDDGDKYSIALDSVSSDTRLLYKKNDSVSVTSAWVELDADFFANASARVRGVVTKGTLWMTNGVDPMKYFKTETDYGLVGAFKPQLQPSIGTAVFAENADQTFSLTGIFQTRQRFVWDEAGTFSNPGPATGVYPYQWIWKENGLKSLTYSSLSIGEEFKASSSDTMTTDRIVGSTLERRFTQYDDVAFGDWYRIDIIDGIQSATYVDSIPLGTTPTVISGDYSEPPIPKYVTTARDCLIGANLQGAPIPVPFDQADVTEPKYAKLGLAKRVKIRIKNNTSTTAHDAIVTINDLQWGASGSPLYIDYDDTGVNAGKDFQFTDDDGITPLYCFRTGYDGTGTASANTVDFKVRVPEIVAYEEKIIYLYYNGVDCNADDNTNWRNVYHRKYLAGTHLALFNMDTDDADLDITGATYNGIKNKAYDAHLTFAANATWAVDRALGFPFGGVSGQCYNAVAATGSITAFATHTDGTLVTDVGHGREAGDLIELYSCSPSGYNGFYHIVTKVSADQFTINAIFTTNGTGSWRTPADGFLNLPATTDGAYKSTSIVNPGSYVNGKIAFKFKWNGGAPSTTTYIIFSKGGGSGCGIVALLEHTAGNEYVRVGITVAGVPTASASLQIDTNGATGGDVFDGGWWYLACSWDEDGAYLRVRSVGGADLEVTSNPTDWTALVFAADEFYLFGTLTTGGFDGYIDEFEITNTAISDEQFDIEFLRETFATAPSIFLEDPEDVTTREDYPDGWFFSLPKRPHIVPASNIRYTGFNEIKGIQYFLNSLYIYHKNKIIRGNISSGSQDDWDNDYTFADKLTIPNLSITGLVSDGGCNIFNMLGNDYQGWVSEGGVKASAGSDPIDISEPINDIFRSKSYAELQHSGLVYSPKYKQLFLQLASAYQDTTSGGTSEATIKAIRNNDDTNPKCFRQQKTFGIDNDGTSFHCCVDWDTVGGTNVVERYIYKRLEAGNWAVVSHPAMVLTGVITTESTKDWRSMSMMFNKARTVLHCVTTAVENSDNWFYVVYNTYTTATDTWGTSATPISGGIEARFNADIALDNSDGYHIVWCQAISPDRYVYYYKSSTMTNPLQIPISAIVDNDNYACSVNVFRNSSKMVLAFGYGTGGSQMTHLRIYQDDGLLTSANVVGLKHACMSIDSENNIHLCGVSPDSDVLYYCKVHYESGALYVGALEEVISTSGSAIVFDDWGITVREINGAEIPVVFYTNDTTKEIYYKKKDGGYWNDAIALGTSATEPIHLVVDQMPLPDRSVGSFAYAGFMDDDTNNRIRVWQSGTYILEANAPATNYYIDQVWCLDLNEETLLQNGRKNFVWSEFTAKTASGRMPMQIPCLWDGQDDNMELLFSCANAAKIFVYGERPGSKYYLDEFTSGTDLIIPVPFKTADIKFYNSIFNELSLVYSDGLSDNSLNLRVYLDGLLLVSQSAYTSNTILQLPFHDPAETITIEVDGTTNYGKTIIERLEFKHLPIARRI